MRPSHLSLAAKATAILCVIALFAGCSGNDSSSPTVTPPTGPSFNFTFPQTGTSHEFQFNDAGSWTYCCTPHGCGGGSMTGTVNVVAAAADSVTGGVSVGPGNSFSFSPQVVTIKPGGRVRWVNASTTTFNHTVTR